MKLPGSLFLVLLPMLTARAQAQTTTPAREAPQQDAATTNAAPSPPPTSATPAGTVPASSEAQSTVGAGSEEDATAASPTGETVAPAPEGAMGTAEMFGAGSDSATTPPTSDVPAAPSTAELDTEPTAPTDASAALQAPSLPRNTIGGHLFLSARAGLAVPFGKIARNTAQGDYAQTGWGFGADLGYGVGRDVALGIYGDLLPLSSTGTCPDCSPLSGGLGVFVRYHLVQGLSFDPWASYGIGVRTLSLQSGAAQGDYVGLEWLRLTFGGDFYPSRYVGFGPYLELGAGSFFSVPAQENAGGVHFRFQTGLRVAVDFMGR